AVPHRTYPGVAAPWAPPGAYTVRLTVDGHSTTQPLTIKMDPRVTTSPAALEQLYSLTTEMYNTAVSLHDAYEQARAAAGSTSDPALVADINKLAPAAPAGGGRGGRGGFGGGRGAAPAGPPTLNGVSGEAMAAAMAMQGSEMAPTAAELAACARARTQAAAVLAQWSALKAKLK